MNHLAKTAKLVVILVVAIICAILAYLAVWSAIYHIPATPARVIDNRLNKDDPAYCVTLCGSLADNPFGFPGHCFVVWSTGQPSDVLRAESAAYLPVKYFDQVPSLWTFVPGKLIDNAAIGNTTNLDTLSVLVSAEDYALTQQLRAEWRQGMFRVGHKDCVKFTDTVAATIKLKRPAAGYKFPQDYIRELKQLN